MDIVLSGLGSPIKSDGGLLEYAISRLQMARLLMLRLVCLTLVFGIAPPAFAQGAPASTPASCSALDSASGTTVGNAITCMIDTVRPNGILVVIVSTSVPILLVIWGARGGFTLIATVVRRMFGFMAGRA